MLSILRLSCSTTVLDIILDNVGSDGGFEDSWERVSRPAGSAIGRGNGDCRTSRHCCCLSLVVDFDHSG